MFDSYTLSAGDQHHSHSHTVTEKRAPTDESVRLLREMEASAKSEVTKAIHVIDNAFNGSVYFVDDYLQMQLKCAVIFTMNGKKIETKLNLPRTLSKQDMIEKIIEAVSCDVAIQILREPLSKAISRDNLV